MGKDENLTSKREDDDGYLSPIQDVELVGFLEDPSWALWEDLNPALGRSNSMCMPCDKSTTSMARKGWRCMDPKTKKFVTSRDVVSNEVSSWYFAQKSIVKDAGLGDDQGDLEPFPPANAQASCDDDFIHQGSEESLAPRLNTPSSEAGEQIIRKSTRERRQPIHLKDYEVQLNHCTGLKKKTHELATLCGVDAFPICYENGDSDQIPMTYPENPDEVRKVMKCYRDQTDLKEDNTNGRRQHPAEDTHQKKRSKTVVAADSAHEEGDFFFEGFTPVQLEKILKSDDSNWNR
ncbi:hypothetical protein NE237_030553 [Protea cynaroides]|uniref:Retroviral polymerase SH3-like domain-containing protein n=1 Tax=Protea cynaroides TaxID=273540 RepID=A0A9Q0GTA0_9MAGN|nr:hypothetical protein NE237_030553 [Protea cynaroides]